MGDFINWQTLCEIDALRSRLRQLQAAKKMLYDREQTSVLCREEQAVRAQYLAQLQNLQAKKQKATFQQVCRLILRP